MITLLVADLAGTTIKDNGLVLKTFLQTCAAFNSYPSEEEINSMMGQKKSEVFKSLGLYPHAAEQYFNTLLLTSYEDNPPEEIPGALKTFRLLRSAGCKIALNTGFHHTIGSRLISLLGWQQEIDVLVCSDEVPEGRPAPYMIFKSLKRLGHHRMDDVAVVDDTKSGILAGLNSGAKMTFGVLTGTDSEFDADMVVDSIADIPELLGY